MLNVNRASNENEKDFIASCEFALKHKGKSDDVVYIDKKNYEMFISDTHFEIKKEYDDKNKPYYVYQKHSCSNLENLFMTLSAVYNIGYNEALKMPIDMAYKYNNNSNFHKVVF